MYSRPVRVLQLSFLAKRDYSIFLAFQKFCPSVHVLVPEVPQLMKFLELQYFFCLSGGDLCTIRLHGNRKGNCSQSAVGSQHNSGGQRVGNLRQVARRDRLLHRGEHWVHDFLWSLLSPNVLQRDAGWKQRSPSGVVCKRRSLYKMNRD